MLTASAAAPRSNGDLWGMCASAVCAFHCAASPLIILLTPALGPWWSSPMVHLLIAFLVVPLALIVLYQGKKRHSQTLPFVLGIIACVMIVVALLPIWGVGNGLHLVNGQFSDAQPEFIDGTCCPSFISGESGWTLFLPWETIITFIGSIFLISAHAANAQALAKKCKCCAQPN